MKKRLLPSLLSACLSFSLYSHAANDVNQHFDPKGKMPSTYTRDKQEQWRNQLPFEDKRDFEESKRGFMAAPKYRKIMKEGGAAVAWNIGQYDWLLDDKPFNSIHPSLQRQATLNMNYGLYKISDSVYQIRGFDLANMTFIKGNTGWIIFDVLTCKETAKAAIDFVNEQLGERPIKAVVYSHSHADHFGGIRGVVDEADVKSGKVQIIAPIGFMEHAVSENVYAGNAMNRRMYFQYGVLLPRSPFGHVDQAIGKSVSAGTTGIIPPTRTIKKDYETLTIDGVKMIFQNTPGTEAPAEMNTYFPDLKTFWAAENITGTIHNIYTLRGALVRDALSWSKHINDALYKFGQDAEIMIASHSWPRWGNDRIQEVMRAQRDTYAHLNNGVLFLANQGTTINQIHNVYKVPKKLEQQWVARSYHGSVPHNSRAVLNRYLGYWDANPATLTPVSPETSAPLYVEMMGGAQPILKKGKALFDKGQYRLAQEILNKLVYAEPQNQKAKDLLADCFEQLGYQYESPSLRNSFLGAAYELRHGIPQGATPNTAGEDMVKGMETDLWLDFLGVRLDSKKAGEREFTINLKTPDINKQYVIELSNGTLTNIEGYQAKDPDLTITINRKDLTKVMMGDTTMDEMVANGTAETFGNKQLIDDLKGMLVQFSPTFELLPGTKGANAPSQLNPFQQEQPADTQGG